MQLSICLAHTALGTLIIPSLRKQRQEDHKFKVILGYMVNLRPPQAIRSPVSETNNSNKADGLCAVRDLAGYLTSAES